MTIQIIILIASLIVILAGANWMVNGASSIAKRTGISEFVIGMLIVGIGTSMPEMVVSFMSAFAGKSDMAIGNVVGSNIFNVLAILGVTALIYPVMITKSNRNKDIPINIAVTFLLIFLGMKFTITGLGSNTLTRMDGAILLVLFVIYVLWSLKNGKNSDAEEPEDIKQYSTIISIALIAVGLGGLILGGRLFVDSATVIAKHFHMSEKLIAITIMSIGTSLPELATCCVAAYKRRGQLALGNILGSNISNILLILGGSALIHPLSFGGMNYVDIGVIAFSSIFILASAFMLVKNKIGRIEGLILILSEIGYMTWLFIS